MSFDRRGFAPAGARNRGLRVAEGDVVVSLDDDIVPPPGLVRAHAHRHTGGGVATFGLRRFIRLPRFFRPTPDVHARLERLPDISTSCSNRPGHVADWRLDQARRISCHPHPYHCFHGCNISYGRLEALDVGGWCESFDGAWGYEDVEFGARLHAAGARIVWVPESLALHLEGDRRDEVARRAGAARNLHLVVRRVPGYGAYRHASGGQPGHDHGPLPEKGARHHEMPPRLEDPSGRPLRPGAVALGARGSAGEGLVLGDQERHQRVAGAAQVVDESDGHVGPL
jgi:glycosyltransferase involved in cell wall biosynthesis